MHVRTKTGIRGGGGWWMAVWVGMAMLAGARTWAAEPGGFADALVFDQTVKEFRGKGGETNFNFTFAFTNTALVPVVIDAVRTSCGCTTAKVPALPWTVAPNGRGEFEVVLDVRGKYGTITKSVFVNSTLGLKPLTVRVVMPDAAARGGAPGMLADDRVRNMQIALADRTAVFRGDCATCHATPAVGKTGASLYLAVCGVCHDSHNRASMVPDLRNLRKTTDLDHWIKWISFGRHGSLMPGFAKSEGGPLTDEQIDSLADYLNRTISMRRMVQAPPMTAPSPLRPRVQRTIQPPPLPGVPVGVPAPGAGGGTGAGSGKSE